MSHGAIKYSIVTRVNNAVLYLKAAKRVDFFFFLWMHLWHMEVFRLEVKLELQLQAYTIATTILDPRCNCSLLRGLWQLHILNPLSEARDQTHILTETVLGS